nr:NACHT domain-containing protein [Pedobacter panaciterrae]
MKPGRKRILKNFVIAFIALYLIQVLLAIGSDSTTAFFKELMKTIPAYWQISILFGVAGLLALVVSLMESNDEGREVNPDWRKPTLEFIKNRAADQFKAKLAGDQLFNITPKIRFSDEKVTGNLKNELYTELNGYSPGSFEELMDCYVNKVKRMIILGNAGSGKTCLLLKMHIALCELAEKDENFPIPLLFDLSDFNQETNNYLTETEIQELFIKWLKRTAITQLMNSGLNQKQATAIVEQYGFMPILDGLDEIERFDFNDYHFFRTIHQYLRRRKIQTVTQYPEIILTCRTTIINIRGFEPDWMTIEEDGSSQYSFLQEIPFSGILHIDPIRDVHAVLTELQRKDPKGTADKVLKSINTYPQLSTVLTTSFNIHMALTLAEKGYNFKNVANAKDLLADYVNYHIEKTSYPKEKAIQWIKLIATQSNNTQVGEVDIFPYSKLRYPVLIIFRVLILLLPTYILADKIISFAPHLPLWAFYLIWLLILFFLVFTLEEKDNYRTIGYDQQKTHRSLVQRLCIFTTLLIIDVALFCYTPFYIFYFGSTVAMALMFMSSRFDLPSFQISSFRLAKKSLLIHLYSTMMAALVTGILIFLILPHLYLSKQTGISMFELPTAKVDAIELFKNTLEMILIVGLASIVSSGFTGMYLCRILMYLSGEFRTNPLKFMNEMTDAGLFTRSGDVYRFRHILIKKWFEAH